MPVSDRLAYPLLRTFGRLEYQLKLRHAFLRADRHGNAMVNWQAVMAAVAALEPADFMERVSAETRHKVLTQARNRPKVQMVVEVNDRCQARFQERNLDLPDREPSDTHALVEAARRVRNNLFHGGKEDAGEQPFDGDDDQWADAALDIVQRLLDLVETGTFGPVEP